MTAGPDERTLRPVADPDPEETLRAALRRRGVGPGGPSMAAPPMPAHPPAPPEQETEPDDDGDRGLPSTWRMRFPWGPKPDDQAAEDEPPARAANDRLPHWSDPDKPHLGTDDETTADDQDDQGDETSEAEADEDAEPDEDDDQPKPRGLFKARRPAQQHRWSRPSMGRPPGLPKKKHNLITWWATLEPYKRWAMFHATGLAGGIWIGAFGYGFRGAEYVKTHDLAELNTLATYGLGVIWLAFDYRVRHTFPPLAWAVRGISTAFILGALWHGTPLADITLPGASS